MKINLIDLFSGIGGFALGLEQAGFEIQNHYFSEIDKHCIANYKQNYPNAINIGSIKDVLRRIGDIDRRCPVFITAGSPCQGFSLAGRNQGLDDPRSSLIREAIAFIADIRPDIYIWENVKGIYSTNAGADFWAVVQQFANIGGYRCEGQLLNTKQYIPQNRERVYFVGRSTTFGGSSRGIFPLRTHNGKSGAGDKSCQIYELYNRTLSEVCPTITNIGRTNTHYVVQENPSMESGNKQPYQMRRVYSDEGIAPALCRHYTDINIGRLDKPRLVETANCFVLVTEKNTNISEHQYNKSNGICQTLQRSNVPKVINEDYIVRRLTEIEAERLQGFPDNWTAQGIYANEIKKIAKTNRYKMIGNAVSVPVVKAVGEAILSNYINGQ